MSNEINLLYNKKQAKNSQLASRVKILRFFAVGLLCLVSLFSIVLFLLVVSSPLPSLIKQKDTLVASLSQSHDVILQQTLLSTRLSEIEKIIKNRSDFSGLISLFEKGLPENAVINQISVEKKIVNFTFSADNLDDITTYLDGLKANVKQKKSFTNVYVVSLTALQNDASQVSGFVAELIIVLL